MVDFDIFEFYKGEIMSENKITRIEAVKKTGLISVAVGEKQTRDDLIPFLIESIKIDPFVSDEEYLYYLPSQFEELGLSDWCVKKTQNDEKVRASLVAIVAALEALACQEETVIREAAVKSLSAIFDAEQHKGLVPELLFPLLGRLADHEVFTARVSACGLFPTAYKHGTTDQKDKLRSMYENLCREDTPMVRRAAADKLKGFVAAMDKQNEISSIGPVWKDLMREQTQDCIRIACLQSALAMSKIVDSEAMQDLKPFVEEASRDRSWRVRFYLAKWFDQVAVAFGTSVTLDWLSAMLKDHEIEVRKEAVKIMTKCLDKGLITPDQLQDELWNPFSSLVNDAASSVRVEVAGVLGPVILKMGKSCKQHLSILTDLMKDEFHDVRLNAVKHTGSICEILGAGPETQQLISQVQSLIMDNQWRIRHSVVQQVPQLARLCGPEVFQQKLESLFISSLTDSVHSVRNAAIENHKEIAQAFGQQWTVERLLPKLVEQYSQNSGYSHRVTTLQVLPKVAGVLNQQQILQVIMPVLLSATKDSVPNVRFCACQKIGYMITEHKLGQKDDIITELKRLIEDPDSDVKYNAHVALKSCQG